MVDTAWESFPDQGILNDTDTILARTAGGGGVEILGSAIVKRAANGKVGLGTTTPRGQFTVLDQGTPTSGGQVRTLVLGEASDTVGYHLAMGMYISGHWRGAIDAVQNNLPSELHLNPSGGAVLPGLDAGQTLGGPTYRWSVVYAGTGAINTSDEREKREIGAIPDEWLDAWGDVDWCRFKFNDGSRWHVGLIAQRVHAAFEARGLDAFEIGLCCLDVWDAVPAMEAREETRDKAGKIIQPGSPSVPAQPAGDRWGLRYDECFAIEAAWQRRELAQLRAAVTAFQHG